MIQNTLFCKRARAAAGGRKQALVWEGYAARLLCHYITLRGDVQARQRQREPCGGMDAPARARAARAAPEPTCPHRATQPARRGRGEREQTRVARGRATGCATARGGFAAGFQRRSAGGQPRRTAGKRRTQQCAGAAALLCRHAGACAPTADDVPTTEGGTYRRPQHGHETPGRHPRRTAGDALTGGFAREHLPVSIT